MRHFVYIRCRDSPALQEGARKRLQLAIENEVISQKRGIYFNVRLGEGRTCALVFIGATEDGNKELLAQSVRKR